MAALLSYKNLESSVNRSFEMVKGAKENGADPSYQVFSKVVSVVVSNPSTQKLSRSVNITFRHLEVIPPVSHPLFLKNQSFTSFELHSNKHEEQKNKRCK